MLGVSLLDLAWFVLIYSVENSYSPAADLTYFNNNKSDREFCKLEKKIKLSAAQKNLPSNLAMISNFVLPKNE